MYPDRLAAAGYRRSYARDAAGQQGIQIPQRTAAMQVAEENSIALDRLRVSQSRAIDPSWAQSSLGSSRFYRLWHLPPSLVSLPLYLKTPLCGGTP